LIQFLQSKDNKFNEIILFNCCRKYPGHRLIDLGGGFFRKDISTLEMTRYNTTEFEIFSMCVNIFRNNFILNIDAYYDGANNTFTICGLEGTEFEHYNYKVGTIVDKLPCTLESDDFQCNFKLL
jgi:hypothetical protein